MLIPILDSKRIMPRAHRSYKLSKISFVTFGVRKLF